MDVTPCAGVWIEIRTLSNRRSSVYVTPCAGVWIEIIAMLRYCNIWVVTPCAGVWIEMSTTTLKSLALPSSLPVRECGLK